LGDVINSQADNRESWKRYVNSRPLLVKPTKRSPTDFMVTGSYFGKTFFDTDKHCLQENRLYISRMNQKLDSYICIVFGNSIEGGGESSLTYIFTFFLFIMHLSEW